MPNISENEMYLNLLNRKSLLKDYCVEDFLTGVFHKAVNLNLLEKCNLKINDKVDTLTEEKLLNLASVIKNYDVEILNCADNNQVFSGGVKLSCLDSNLQSKRTPNLYCIGELVDVDGVCGGYNLQWAWTSGKVVGDNL
jgi:predicted flavoprotein YhiN